MEGQLEMDGREVCRTKPDCFIQRIPSTQKGKREVMLSLIQWGSV